MSKICQKCGYSQDDNAKFCMNCGASLNMKEEFHNQTGNHQEKVSHAYAQASGFIKGLMHVIYTVCTFLANKLAVYYKKKYGQDYSSLSSDEKYQVFYDAMEKQIKLLYKVVIATFAIFLLYGITKIEAILYFYLIAVIVAVLSAVVWLIIYVFPMVKSKWSAVAIKLLTGLFISLVILGLTMLFPPLAILLLILTIYKNRQRRNFLDKYKRYTRYLIRMALIIFVFQLISGGFDTLATITSNSLAAMGNELMLYSGYIDESQIDSMINGKILRIAIYQGLAVCALLLGYVFAYKANIKFFKKEQARGMSYDDCVRLTWLVPLTWFFLVFSCLSLIHSSFFSADSIMADTGFDTNFSPDVNVADNNTFNDVAGTMDVTQTTDTVYNMDSVNINNNAESFADNDSMLHGMSRSNSDFAQSDLHNTMNTTVQQSNVDSSSVDGVVDNTPVAHENHTTVVDDATGFSTGRIKDINDTTSVIQDNLSQTVAVAHTDIFKNMSIMGADGMSVGEITADGVIKGIDGLTDGHIVALDDGSMIVQDTQNMTIAKITANNIVVGADGMPIAILKTSV